MGKGKQAVIRRKHNFCCLSGVMGFDLPSRKAKPQVQLPGAEGEAGWYSRMGFCFVLHNSNFWGQQSCSDKLGCLGCGGQVTGDGRAAWTWTRGAGEQGLEDEDEVLGTQCQGQGC